MSAAIAPRVSMQRLAPSVLGFAPRIQPSVRDLAYAAILREAVDAWNRDPDATTIEARVAGVLDDPRFQAAYMHVCNVVLEEEAVGVSVLSERNDDGQLVRMPAVVMEDPATRGPVERAERAATSLMELVASGRLAAATANDPGLPAATPREVQLTDMLWFVYDPLLPVVWVEGNLALLRSETAIVLLDALREHSAPTAEVQRALARMWAAEYLRYAQYVSGVSGLVLSEFDGTIGASTAQILAEQQEIERLIHERFEAAIPKRGE